MVYISTSERIVDFWTRNVMTVPRGTGSGFIWDEEGHVITNLHVVAGAASANVRLADGRDYKAPLGRREPGCTTSRFSGSMCPRSRPPPIPVGTSADLQVGQKVFAIGNPFGLDWTLTTGIVSALDRSLNGDDGSASSSTSMQTDAAINPGNSGGPLLDSAGRLIGINTTIYSPSGASAGVGFAVPVDTVNRVVPQLIATGHYAPPSIGVETDEVLSRIIARQLGVVGSGDRSRAAGKRGCASRASRREERESWHCHPRRRDHGGGWQEGGERREAARHSRRLQSRLDCAALRLARRRDGGDSCHPSVRRYGRRDLIRHEASLLRNACGIRRVAPRTSRR